MKKVLLIISASHIVNQIVSILYGIIHQNDYRLLPSRVNIYAYSATQRIPRNPDFFE